MNLSEKRQNFLNEVNSKLGPALHVIYEPRGETERFVVSWQTTPYAYEDQVVIKDAFTNLIRNVGDRWYGCEPEFNNTHNTFWWIF